MKDIQKVLEDEKKELENLKKRRQKAEINELVELDQAAARLEMHIRLLEDALKTQERKNQETAPKDPLLIAKLHQLEFVEAAVKDNADMNSCDKRLVAADRMQDAIDRLQALRIAAADSDLPKPEAEELTNPLQHFAAEKRARVDAAIKMLTDQENEIARIEAALKEATDAGDPEAIIAHSDSLKEARKKRIYLDPMLEAAKESDTFPDGTIGKKWDEVCRLYRDEWQLRYETTREAAKAYQKACDDLISLTKELQHLRNALQSYGQENGSKEDIINL